MNLMRKDWLQDKGIARRLVPLPTPETDTTNGNHTTPPQRTPSPPFSSLFSQPKAEPDALNDLGSFESDTNGVDDRESSIISHGIDMLEPEPERDKGSPLHVDPPIAKNTASKTVAVDSPGSLFVPQKRSRESTWADIIDVDALSSDDEIVLLEAPVSKVLVLPA